MESAAGSPRRVLRPNQELPMAQPPDLIPPEVLAAVRAGNGFEAIKLLRKSGLGLKDAKAWMDAHAGELIAAAESGGARKAKRPPGQPTPAPQRGQPAQPAPSYNPMAPLPPEVIEALQKGQKLHAIGLMRQLTGAGLREAKEAVDGYQLTSGATLGGLSPGQVGSTGGTLWWWIVLGLVGLAIYFAFR